MAMENTFLIGWQACDFDKGKRMFSMWYLVNLAKNGCKVTNIVRSNFIALFSSYFLCYLSSRCERLPCEQNSKCQSLPPKNLLLQSHISHQHPHTCCRFPYGAVQFCTWGRYPDLYHGWWCRKIFQHPENSHWWSGVCAYTTARTPGLSAHYGNQTDSIQHHQHFRG